MEKEILRYDILKELFNISIGKAASLLSDIINRKVLLNVPDIKIINVEDITDDFESYFKRILKGALMVSSVSFDGKLNGYANLIFPAEKMRNFINLCLNNEEQVSISDMNFTDMDFDVIKEIGNIILNSVVGEVGNSLSMDLSYTLPKVKVYDSIDFYTDIDTKGYHYMLLLYITFVIDNTEIKGAVIIDFTVKSLDEFMKRIDELGNEIDG